MSNFVRSHKLFLDRIGNNYCFCYFFIRSRVGGARQNRLLKRQEGCRFRGCGANAKPPHHPVGRCGGCNGILICPENTAAVLFYRDSGGIFTYSSVPVWVNSRLSNDVAAQMPFSLGRYRSFTRSPGCVRDSSALMSYGTVKIRCGLFSRMTR